LEQAKVFIAQSERTYKRFFRIIPNPMDQQEKSSSSPSFFDETGEVFSESSFKNVQKQQRHQSEIWRASDH
jgi:hypothetical protein